MLQFYIWRGTSFRPNVATCKYSNTTAHITSSNVDMFKFGSHPAFIHIFLHSCSVDLQHWLLNPWIKNGRSKNSKPFVTANESLFFTLYFIIYGGVGFKRFFLSCLPFYWIGVRVDAYHQAITSHALIHTSRLFLDMTVCAAAAVAWKMNDQILSWVIQYFLLFSAFGFFMDCEITVWSNKS